MRFRLAAVLLLAAVAIYLNGSSVTPAPSPPPPPPELDLSAAFTGPTAAQDAVAIATMSAEIADIIAWDGSQQEPLLRTATQLDLLRTRTREFMCDGVSIGDRQPRARQIIGDYLTAELGTSGGEVDDETRSRWVTAYRTIAESAQYVVD